MMARSRICTIPLAGKCLEEQVAGVTTESYVWSPIYIDAMIARDQDTDSNGTLDERCM